MTTVLDHLSTIKRRLRQRHEALTGRMRSEARDENELVFERDADWEDLAARQGLAGRVNRLAERNREELVRIEAALRRIDVGVYSNCSACGDRIAVERLLVLPESEMCSECAEFEAPSVRRWR